MKSLSFAITAVLWMTQAGLSGRSDSSISHRSLSRVLFRDITRGLGSSELKNGKYRFAVLVSETGNTIGGTDLHILAKRFQLKALLLLERQATY